MCCFNGWGAASSEQTPACRMKWGYGEEAVWGEDAAARAGVLWQEKPARRPCRNPGVILPVFPSRSSGSSGRFSNLSVHTQRGGGVRGAGTQTQVFLALAAASSSATSRTEGLSGPPSARAPVTRHSSLILSQSGGGVSNGTAGSASPWGPCLRRARQGPGVCPGVWREQVALLRWSWGTMPCPPPHHSPPACLPGSKLWPASLCPGLRVPSAGPAWASPSAS